MTRRATSGWPWVEGSHGHYTLAEYEYVPQSGKRTNRWLILRWGAAERAFRMTEVSNSELQPKAGNL
jgi:hypothetical protein